MKNVVYIWIFSLLLISCGEYQKVLNKGTIKEQYKMAVKMYEAQKYSKALRLFEKVTPSYRAKPQMERIQYMVANSNFNIKNYGLAGHYFDRFSKNYPKSSKREEASFLSALSYYKATPSFSLDQSETSKAINAFQKFIDDFPEGSRNEEANKYYKKLRYKLEKKSFEIAKTYYNTADYDSRNYKAAIQAFDNLLEEFLGTEFKEEALYFRFKAAHDFALKSTQRRKEKRLKDAVKAYEKLIRNFPESKFLKDSDKMLAKIHKEQKQFVKS